MFIGVDIEDSYADLAFAAVPGDPAIVELLVPCDAYPLWSDVMRRFVTDPASSAHGMTGIELAVALTEAEGPVDQELLDRLTDFVRAEDIPT